MDATQRFTNRVDDYVKYRPSYPPAVIDFIRACGASPGARVADIGAGTGISTKLLLDAGYTVTAVEPNQAMRAAADAWLGAYPGYRSVAGTAEATTLETGSVGLVTVAQAFHWFDENVTRREFSRILAPDGLVALFWNSRLTGGTPFLEGYEALLQRYGLDYRSVSERYGDDAQTPAWFGAGFVGSRHVPHVQRLDFEQLKGRLMSSSYAPKEDHPNHAPLIVALRELFERTARDGAVEFAYDTLIYVGRPDAPRG
jgi:SAM-dependent methyltransferase